jgi:hypothetical protein
MNREHHTYHTGPLENLKSFKFSLLLLALQSFTQQYCSQLIFDLHKCYYSLSGHNREHMQAMLIWASLRYTFWRNYWRWKFEIFITCSLLMWPQSDKELTVFKKISFPWYIFLYFYVFLFYFQSTFLIFTYTYTASCCNYNPKFLSDWLSWCHQGMVKFQDFHLI